MKMDLKTMTVGFIGGGNMAQAIASGFIKEGVLDPSKIWVSSRTEKTLNKWEIYGVNTTLKNGQVLENCDVIFLAVKPYVLDTMLKDTLETLSNPDRTKAATVVDPNNPDKRQGKLFISVLAGVTLDLLSIKLHSISNDPRIIRTMPNTPMMVGEGILVYCTQNTFSTDEDLIKTLFSPLGICERVPESLINPISGVAGSSPAFIFLMIEALADGAVKMGVPHEMAMKFAAQAMVGSGKMVLKTGKHPGELKDQVCSPGGTTIVGMHMLESGAVRASIMNAVEAAVKKSDALLSNK